MYLFILALLLVSINALTPVPTASVTSGATPIPTSNGNSPTFAVTTSPTPAPIAGSVPTLRPTVTVTGISPSPTPGPTPSPATVPSLVPTKSPINGALSRCMTSDNLLDIIFIVDSSGSVWDDGYKNWENELELVYDIIDNVIPINSRVGLINFSGCGSSYSFIDCKNQNRLKQMISLNDNGTPNDLDAVLSTVDAIDQDDFNGGYTWTNEALGMALTEFAENSAADTDKMVILITDGEPYPRDQGHEPCKTSTGYVSPTLQSLQELGVLIMTVGIDIHKATKEEYFDCISGTDFYFDSTFDSNSYSYAPTNVPANGINVPTPSPTPSPVSGGSVISPVPTQSQGVSDGNSPTMKPTPSPTAVPGSSQKPTANASPSLKPTKSPASGSGLSPAPTPQVTTNGSPTNKPTPSPTANGSPSLKPTKSPTVSGTVPTLHPTANVMHGVPTYYPSPAPIMAVEDLSDSIGDTICSELGSSRMIVPTTKPTLMPIGGGNAVPTRSPTPSPIGSIQGICEAAADLDIVFMVDSSGSVYDDGFNNWQSELDLVSDIISSLPSTSTRASLINFSGCGASFSLAQCKEQGRLNTVFDLNTYGTNLDMVSSRIAEMDSDDFLGGYTWTNEALGLALQQFNSYSNGDKTKVIVLLTDGEPYPYDQGHEACVTSTNYESDILKSLNELGVNIITVGIDISVQAREETLGCISELYFGVSQFSTLNSLSTEIGELICNEVGGDFKLSLQPTPEPTPSPISNAPTTSDEATRGPITSNGIMANIYINLAIISGFIGFLLF